MRAIRSAPFLAILAAGLLLRFVLAEVVVPGAGFAGDLRQFESWATALAATGPGAFYATTHRRTTRPATSMCCGSSA